MSDDWKPLPPDSFVARMASGPSPDPLILNVDLERRLLEAQREGLEANIRRQYEFLGSPALLELQVLGVRKGNSSYESSFAAHAESADDAVRLATEADRWVAHGMYVLCALLKSGVETRLSAPGKWFEVPKGGGTKDADVEARINLAVDFDVQRPTNTSATSAELEKSVRTSLRAWNYLSGALRGENALAYLHSGNGRQIHIALDCIPNDDETRSLCSGVLVGMASLFDSDEVKVDQKLFDAKRILPACGTVKKKGAAGIADRPHRRTAILLGAPEPSDADETAASAGVVRRLSLDDLKALARQIWNDTDDDGRAAMSKAMGIKPAAPPQTVSQLTPSSDSPFARANAVAPGDVAMWLGVYDGTTPVCPGCGESKGVAVLNHGFKCSHNRCQGRGRNGFRTNVDLVAEVRSVSPRDAVNALAERFGFEGLGAGIPAASFTPITSTQATTPTLWGPQLAEPLGPIPWICQDLTIAPGRPTVFAGEGGTRKGWLAMAIQVCAASGQKLFGRVGFKPNMRTIYFDYEQGSRMSRQRFQLLAGGLGISLYDLGERLGYRWRPLPTLAPTRETDRPKVIDELCKLVDGIDLVVVDSLRACSPGIEENGVFSSLALDIATDASERTGTTFLFLDHAGKPPKDPRENGRTRKHSQRGHSSKLDANQTLFVFSSKKGDPTFVTCERSQLVEEDAWPKDFTFNIVSALQGLFLLEIAPVSPSAVPPPTPSEDDPEELSVEELERICDKFLAIVTEHTGASFDEIKVRMKTRTAHVRAARDMLEREGRIQNLGSRGRPQWAPKQPSKPVPTRPNPSQPVPEGFRSPPDKPVPSSPSRPPIGDGRDGLGRLCENDEISKNTERDDLGRVCEDPQTTPNPSQPVPERDVPTSEPPKARSKPEKRPRRKPVQARSGPTPKHEKDAWALAALGDDEDKAAWAKEQGWSDERFLKAMDYLNRDHTS